MRLGDAPDGPQARGSRIAEAVPITSRSGGVALLDADDPATGLAPPWQRMPQTPAVRLAAAPDGAPVAPARAPRRPVRPVTELATRRPTPAGHRPPVLSARPPVVEEPSILGLSRRARSRLGSRLFTLFFVAVFTLIAVQMVLAILYG